MTELENGQEKAKARALRQSRWWQNLIRSCVCHYCGAALSSTSATMDHIVPISRGGRSTRGNVVPACKACNTQKRDRTAVDMILAAATDQRSI